ncbi:MAG: hypothetical protein AAF840_08270 [Bacteroidota bacterium]
MEEQYHKIEEYLAGALTGDELQAFEASLASDAALRAEVALHQQLQATFADPQEIDLRLTLQQISAEGAEPEEPDDPSGEGSGRSSVPWGWWLGGGLLLAVAALLIQQFLAPASAPETTSEELSGLYAPNPTLEALADTLTNVEYDFELAAQPNEPGTNRLKVEGSLYAFELPADSTFLLQLYDNTQMSYPDQPVFAAPVVPIEVSDTVIAFGRKKRFAFLFDEEVSLEKGLYYFVVREGEELPVLKAGRVRMD